MARLQPTSDMRLLDVAGGTGDIAFRFLDAARSQHSPPYTAHVTVVDINPEMLAVGEARARAQGYTSDREIKWLLSNAEQLEAVPSESVDAYTIAFGIRNCTNIDKVVQEAYRVLKPGGRFLCLEFGKVQNPWVRRFIHLKYH